MSAISGPAQENFDFYSGVLGFRLVKLTVNFDDPTAYHLYYGDGAGSPGSIVTFFPYPNGYPGRPGSGQVTVTSLSVPHGSLTYWADRFKEFEVDFDRVAHRGSGHVLPFRAPDGLPLELVAASDHVPGVEWDDTDVLPEFAISVVRSVTMVVRQLEPTAELLTGLLGFRLADERENRHRYEVAEGGPGKSIEVVVDAEGPVGRPGHGSVHHVAFRIADDAEQLAAKAELTAAGFQVSPVMDRDYFRSIYFREPGGVLLEIATDGPGFTTDETLEDLGGGLRLPSQFANHRRQIERSLPPLKIW
ncbi:ring-cleaving dioxygenase [Fimbriimonas ginsengisoli]|nr:ring-cleaving dioxygenase [Fimbriimonas ginsengisoli]